MDAALFHAPRKRRFRLPDGEAAALDFGDTGRQPDVLFLHANGFNAMTYRAILGPLSLGLRIIALDLRGHGESTLPTETRGRRSWNDLRDDLIGVLDALDGPAAKPLVLSGHSMGGATALLAAPERPERVKSLVLFDPVILPPLYSLFARMPWAGRRLRASPMAVGAAKRRSVFDSVPAAFAAYKGRGAFKTWPDMALADYVAGGFRDRPDGTVELACSPAWESSNFSSQGHRTWRALRRLPCPLTVLKAEHNSTCSLPVGEGRGVRVAVIPGASHFLPMERPDVVRDALLEASDG